MTLGGVGSLGLLKALCCSARGVRTWVLPEASQSGWMLRWKPCITDREPYLFKGEPERCSGHLETFCRARNCCCSCLHLPAPNLRWARQRLPRAGELLSACSDGRSRISVFLPALVLQAFWSVFCPNGKRIMRNCLNNLWYKETRWSKVQHYNLFPRK